MVGIIKQNLKEYNPEAYDIFCNKMKMQVGVTSKKRDSICQSMDTQIQKMYYWVRLIN